MKYHPKIILVLTGMFLLSQIAGLAFVYGDLRVVRTPAGALETVHPETAIGPRPEVDRETGEPLLFILSGVLIGTLLLLLIIRFARVNFWRVLFFVAVLSTITVALGVFLDPLLAFVLAVALAVLKLFKPNQVMHNLTEILVYAGIAVLFVPLFNVFWAAILLLVISAYDAFAVWQSRHMVKMAKFQAGAGLFAGFHIRFQKGASPGQKAARTERAEREGAGQGEAILGGGDVAFPLIFSGAVMEWLVTAEQAGKEAAFALTLAIPLVLAAVLLLLLLKGREGRFYPAMPFLTAGCLAGLALIGLFALFV